MFTILAGMAEFERELIRSRIQDKLDLKRAQGELCGTIPFGWDAVETGAVTPKGVKVRKLVPNDEEQKWIRTMDHCRRCGWSYDRIAKHLNENNVPTKRGKGTIMKLRCSSSSSSSSSSSNRFVTGQWQCGNVAKVLANKTVREWLASLGSTGNLPVQPGDPPGCLPKAA